MTTHGTPPWRGRRSRRRLVAIVAACGIAAATLTAPGTAAVAATAPAAVTSGADGLFTVTLLTGDRVHVKRYPGGRQAVLVEPREGGSGDYSQSEVDGELHVMPMDAVPYVASGQLDRDLFNITDLIANGYDDARSKTIDLVVSYGDAKSAAAVPQGAQAGATLESINGRAVRAAKNRAGTFWKTLAGTGPAVAPRLAHNVAKVWLDERVTASLDRSVPQIGAPQAWQAGYDGSGVTVAVLDTGIDATHPDVAGKVVEARNFSNSPDVVDRHGHGTHVASTVAGSGAASDGSRRGVAPGARLLVGKVLGDNGTGSLSMLIDGMEWAAGAGADVVNLSLGSAPSDGTDPLSVAVNELTAATGTLFVVAAGNDGESGEYTVNAPGSADAALTVGAVDRAEALAPFSSRGPRTDDLAVKPDITAPGVAIVAARAAGTSMGTPVDDNYTAASGTSMATPHVAGAAAILAQQHPGWQAQQLKDALVSTARVNAGQTVYEQGGGRVDVARVTDQKVHATGTVSLGELPANVATPVTRTLTYTNTSTAAVTLTLAVDLRNAAGQPAPEAVRLSASTVDIAAGTSASVTITADPAKLADGRYGGYVTATAADVAVHTTVGVAKAAPRHTVTFTAVGRDGEPAMVQPLTLHGPDSRDDYVGYLPAGATRTIEVAEGEYFLYGSIRNRTEERDGDVYSVVTNPQLRIDRDMHVTLDARAANEVVIRTPQPAVQDGVWSTYSYRTTGSRGIGHGLMTFATSKRLYVTPTTAVTSGTFEFNSRWQLVAPRVSGLLDKGTFAPELNLLHQSPLLDGNRRLSLVDVGAGHPEDYEGVDVAGNLAVISHDNSSEAARVADAAQAGAAAALIIVRDNASARAVWRPTGDRLPILAMRVSHHEGTRLLDLVRAGAGRLTLNGVPHSPYLYDVLQVSKQQIPQQVVHQVHPGNTATVVTRYHDNGGDPWAKEQRFGWRVWMGSAINQYQRFVGTPHERREYVSADPDTLWTHFVHHRYTFDTMNPLATGMTQQPQRYRPGQHLTESWYAPVSRPAIPRGAPELASYRAAGIMSLRIPEWVDANAGHYSRADAGDWGGVPADKVNAKLYRNGELLAEHRNAWADFAVGTDPASYRLELAVARNLPEWRYATGTKTVWTFRSTEPAAGQRALLPLLQLDYDVPVDPAGTVAGRDSSTLGITARHQDGLVGVSVRNLDVWASFDNGATWAEATKVVSTSNGRFVVKLRHPGAAAGSTVSLRVRASDSAGNTVEQTVLQAYGVR